MKAVDWIRGRRPNEAGPIELEKLQAEIEQARSEWAIAQQQLDHVSDPDLIDHAIYYLEAAERKYGFLLREAKRLKLDIQPQQRQALLE
ncbi:hypothetical protein CIG75_00060 [Tumebacillus algifaecis]|uniref:DUF2508 domain-containing protein n=2 Tax=Tumebacillus algifaecis TaxID=1214604 RepID=A0A223D661_9BACL|nr:hypothetical protein CIG75_00060 [Tumebacillus algifaecis]